MNLINKDKLSNKFGKFITTNKPTNYKKTDWLEISDILIEEIKSKYYEITNNLGESELIDLKLVDEISEIETDNFFNSVESLTFKDRDLAIENKLNTIINNNFKNKSIKLHIPDYPLLLKNGFVESAVATLTNPGIIKVPIEAPGAAYIMDIYLDYIEDDDEILIQTAIDNGLIIRTDNSTKESTIPIIVE